MLNFINFLLFPDEFFWKALNSSLIEALTSERNMGYLDVFNHFTENVYYQ